MRVSPGPVSYTSRRGEIYYLHGGLTKTGKPRYFVAKTAGEGVLAQLPDKFEIVESINGVVSVRRVDPDVAKVPEAELERVRAGLAGQPHLRRHRADVVKGEIVVFEPIGGLSDGVARVLTEGFGMTRGHLEHRLGDLEAHTRYTPVMKLVPCEDGYLIYRMTYRGEGGWSGELAFGSLDKLVGKYVPRIGTDRFFELW